MICAKAEIDQTKLSIGSRAARIFCHKVAYRLLRYIVANLWLGATWKVRWEQEREVRKTENITRKTQLSDVCRDSFLCVQRISQTDFSRAGQSKSIGSKCCQNYHQHVMVSCTWIAGEERGEKARV